MSSHLPDFVVHKAQQDPQFREALLRDPRAAIQSAFPQASLPDDFAIDVLEEDAKRAYIVLPAGRVDNRLSEEQLEQVAGGGCVPCFAARRPPED